MKKPTKKPQISYWSEPIDGVMIARHAVRCWAEVDPRYSVFIIYNPAEYRRWQIDESLKAKLELFEEEIEKQYHYRFPRAAKSWAWWANNGEIFWGGTIGAIPADDRP